jgi:uncharacterized membrane protein YoaK (UPF0700 family)
MSIARLEVASNTLQQHARREDKDTEQQRGAITLTLFVADTSQRALRVGLLLLLTLAAGWTDALCYLIVSRVFASFMTGNILFVGLALAQRDSALLARAGVALLLFLASVTLGSLSLQRLPARQSVARWRATLARHLLVEALILLAFALLWALSGDLVQHPERQLVLLGVAAVGMGWQGALVAACDIPNFALLSASSRSR